MPGHPFAAGVKYIKNKAINAEKKNHRAFSVVCLINLKSPGNLVSSASQTLKRKNSGNVRDLETDWLSEMTSVEALKDSLYNCICFFIHRIIIIRVRKKFPHVTT